MLGDFVKGTPESLAGHFPPAVVQGIRLHRAVDRFTDAHPAFHEAKKLLAPERRRFAGLIVDIIFDHLLIKNWARYHEQPLADFLAEIYEQFDAHPQLLTPRMATLLPRLKAENWLGINESLAGLSTTMSRVSTRRPFLRVIKDAHLDFTRQPERFDKHFLCLYPDLIRLATRQTSEHS
ncbi:MAG: ACP phosphodiesterase [Verrucomicrobiales bacterium]